MTKWGFIFEKDSSESQSNADLTTNRQDLFIIIYLSTRSQNKLNVIIQKQES